MKAPIILSLLCCYATTIFAGTPPASPLNRRKGSDKTIIPVSNVMPSEYGSSLVHNVDVKDQEIQVVNNIEKQEEKEEILEAYSAPSPAQLSDACLPIAESQKIYDREIETVAQYTFDKNPAITIDDYPSDSYLTISFNPTESHFVIAGNKAIYLYSAENGMVEKKFVSFCKPIVNTQFINDIVVKVTMHTGSSADSKQQNQAAIKENWWNPSLDTTTIPIQPDTFDKVQKIKTAQRLYTDFYIDIFNDKTVHKPQLTQATVTNHVNLSNIPYYPETCTEYPVIFGKKIIEGKKRAIALISQQCKPIEILLHNTDTFHKTYHQLNTYTKHKVPTLLAIFNAWKKNKPYPKAFLKDEHCYIKGDLNTAIQDLNDNYPQASLYIVNEERSKTPPPHSESPPPLYEYHLLTQQKSTEDDIN